MTGSVVGPLLSSYGLLQNWRLVSGGLFVVIDGCLG